MPGGGQKRDREKVSQTDQSSTDKSSSAVDMVLAVVEEEARLGRNVWNENLIKNLMELAASRRRRELALGRCLPNRHLRDSENCCTNGGERRKLNRRKQKERRSSRNNENRKRRQERQISNNIYGRVRKL